MPHRRLILGLLALGILTALIFAFIRPREPSYQGRSLSQWLVKFDTWDSSLAAQAEAEDAIRHMGTNVIPHLLRYIRHEESPGTSKALTTVQTLLAKAGINWELTGRERVPRAERALIALGLDANAAIPELVRLMNDPKAPRTACAAAATLTSIGTREALPPVLTVLTNKNHPGREVVALNMFRMGTNAGPAIPALIQCLQDTNAFTTYAAAMSLGELKLAPNLAVPALTATLQASDPMTRARSAQALAHFRSEARSAVPQLLKILQDPDWSARRAATNALRQIAPETLTNAPPK